MNKKIILTLVTVLLLTACSNPEKELRTALIADIENFETLGADLYTETSALLTEIGDIHEGGEVTSEKSLKEANAYTVTIDKLSKLIESYDEMLTALDSHLEIHDTYKGKKEETLELRSTFESLKSEYVNLKESLVDLKAEVVSIQVAIKELSDLAYAYEQAKAKGTLEGENTIYFTNQYDLNEMNRLQDETNLKIDSTNTKNKGLVTKLMTPEIKNMSINILLESYIKQFDEETKEKKK